MLNTLSFIAHHPLTRGHLPSALLRIAHWQIQSRIQKQTVLPWVSGTKLIARRSMHAVTGNYYCGLMEFEEMAFLLHFLRPGDLFVDVGANVGTFTVLASGVVGAKTIAFEPNPSTFSDLEANVRGNGIGIRTELHQMALSEASGETAITTGLGPMNHLADPGETGTLIVPVATLDSMLDGRKPVLIKVDVEGHETEVLRGGRNTLTCPSLLAVQIETLSPEIRQALIDEGFVKAHYDPFTRTLSRGEGTERSTANDLFVRSWDETQLRLSSAKKFAIHSFWI